MARPKQTGWLGKLRPGLPVLVREAMGHRGRLELRPRSRPAARSQGETVYDINPRWTARAGDGALAGRARPTSSMRAQSPTRSSGGRDATARASRRPDRTSGPAHD